MLRGTLGEALLPKAADDSLYVWLEEGGDPVAVREGEFTLAGLPPGVHHLRIGDGRETLGRMEVRGVPEGGEVVLEEIRVHRESGLAFPAAVRLEAAPTILVNGLRLAPPGALPGEVEEEGVALAVADGEDALLFRPADARLPDLRVVLTPATETVTPDGDPVDREVLGAGDSLRVEGGVESGFVVARRIVLPRGLAVRESPGDERPDGSVGASSGGAGRGAVREESRGRDEARGRDESRGRDDGRGKGKGKEKGKGKGGGKKKD